MNISPQEKILWEEWFKSQDRHVADDLVLNYMYLITFHVDRMAVNLPQHVSRDDLESFALFGLFDALNKFEANRGLKFDTYASFRIRGSIIDGLRQEDWLPRSLREKTKQIEVISQELEQTLQRAPNSKEIADKMGITYQEVESIISDTLFSNILSMDGKQNNRTNDDEESIGAIIPDKTNRSPDQHILNVELKKELSEGIKTLNKNEKMVISLFYDDELTMTEIGEILDLTTSRISQIHKNAIFKLRKVLQKIQAQS